MRDLFVRNRHPVRGASLIVTMDDLLSLHRTTRTVAVVIAYATDLPRAVSVLVAEFGFDATFCALAAITGDVRAHQAMWIALEAEAGRGDAADVGVAHPGGARRRS